MRVISEGVADASALKMCYGALNKGTQALWLEVLIAAQRLGVANILEREWSVICIALDEFPQRRLVWSLLFSWWSCACCRECRI